jgi:RNA-splicing ligase RtcB
LYAPLSEVEPDAVQQLIKVAKAGIATGYVSAMPDVHLGMHFTAWMRAVVSAVTDSAAHR